MLACCRETSAPWRLRASAAFALTSQMPFPDFPRLLPAPLPRAARCAVRPHTAGRAFCGVLGLLWRVGSDQRLEHLGKAFDRAARAEGLQGDPSAFAQQEQFVGKQFGIAQPGFAA
jgi:hypothetical protein